MAIPNYETAPRMPLPGKACDTHTHVFGPTSRFPFQLSPAYAPPDAPRERHLSMLDAVGMSRAILVQPAPYGDDCAAIIDAVAAAPDRLRGIGTVLTEISSAEMAALSDSGIVGLRFVETGGARMAGAAGLDTLRQLAPVMRAAGMHVQLWADCARIAENAEWLTALGMPVVIEHMGRFDPDRGTDAAEFQTVVQLVRDGLAWIKLGVCRTSAAPDYTAARPFHDALVAANPDRVLWASDWPYVKMEESKPDPGKLVDLFDDWTGHDQGLRQKVFVDNPATLYGFDR